MKRNYFLSSIFLIISIVGTAQESNLPEDFGFPKNTQMALEIKGLYNGDTKQFKQTVNKEYLFNNKRQLSKLKELLSANIGSQDTYHYDADGNLVKVDYLVGTKSGPIVNASIHSIEKEGNKTTYTRKDPNGDELKTVAFSNDKGELRGKTFYDKYGKKEKYIEYNGSNEYRTKKYKNDKEVTSDIVYVKNQQGKLKKTIEYIQPNDPKSLQKVKYITYNQQGDPVKMEVYVPVKSGKEPNRVMDTYVMEYLYDDGIWVASVEYSPTTYKVYESVAVTIRRIKTPEKMYTAKNEKQVMDFLQQAYQNYKKSKQ